MVVHDSSGAVERRGERAIVIEGQRLCARLQPNTDRFIARETRSDGYPSSRNEFTQRLPPMGKGRPHQTPEPLIMNRIDSIPVFDFEMHDGRPDCRAGRKQFVDTRNATSTSAASCVKTDNTP